MAAFFSLVGSAITAIQGLFQLATFVVLGGSSQYSSAFRMEQLHALAQMLLDLNAQTGYIAIVFFGVFNLLIGYLIFRSTFLPRILGALMAFSGLGWLIFLSPPLANHLLTPLEGLGILAEGALMLWLLVMGVNGQRWTEQASAAGIPSPATRQWQQEPVREEWDRPDRLESTPPHNRWMTGWRVRGSVSADSSPKNGTCQFPDIRLKPLDPPLSPGT